MQYNPAWKSRVSFNQCSIKKRQFFSPWIYLKIQSCLNYSLSDRFEQIMFMRRTLMWIMSSWRFMQLELWNKNDEDCCFICSDQLNSAHSKSIQMQLFGQNVSFSMNSWFPFHCYGTVCNTISSVSSNQCIWLTFQMKSAWIVSSLFSASLSIYQNISADFFSYSGLRVKSVNIRFQQHQRNGIPEKTWLGLELGFQC